MEFYLNLKTIGAKIIYICNYKGAKAKGNKLNKPLKITITFHL